jgi:hypothetical protein
MPYNKHWRITTMLLAVIVLLGMTFFCVQVQIPSRKRRQDMQAAINMHVLVNREEQYHKEKGQYAGTFADLQPPVETQPQFPGPDGCSNGYRYSLEVSGSGYELRARPDKWGESACRSFYADKESIRYPLEHRFADSRDIPEPGS